MPIDSVLKDVPLFQLFSPAQLQALEEGATRIEFEADQTVFREGDGSASMYVILSGNVKVFKQDQQGQEVIIDDLKKGDFFGEMALVSSEPRSATIVTVTPCTFLIIERPLFLQLVTGASADVLLAFFDLVAGKVRQLSNRFFKEEMAKQALQAEMKLASQRSLTQMVAGVAHELNTPLGTVNTCVSVLQRILTTPAFAGALQEGRNKRDLADALEAVQLMGRNIERAAKLVQNFKKVSVSQLTDTLETMNLPEMVADAVSLYKANAKIAKLNIIITDRLEGDKVWVGYRGYMTQILLNFLTNAERYAYDPGVGGTIDITLEGGTPADLPTYVMTVRDYGHGISAEALPKVFDPFFTTGRSKGGTGLGMAIVHSIVTNALHGTIRVASEVGKGANFTVTFPKVVTA